MPLKTAVENPRTWSAQYNSPLEPVARLHENFATTTVPAAHPYRQHSPPAEIAPAAPAGVAVVSVAETLMGVVCYFATYHYLSITHIKWTNNSDPWEMCVLAMAGQAIARNSHIVWTDDPFNVNGAGTLENVYEVAGHAIIGAVCG